MESTIIPVPRVQAEDQLDANPVNVTATNSGKDTQIQGAKDKANSESKDSKEDKPGSQDVPKAKTVPAVSHVPNPSSGRAASGNAKGEGINRAQAIKPSCRIWKTCS